MALADVPSAAVGVVSPAPSQNAVQNPLFGMEASAPGAGAGASAGGAAQPALPPRRRAAPPPPAPGNQL